ncbi:MAG: CBS domain-containing protein [Thermoprotei archaeon]
MKVKEIMSVRVISVPPQAKVIEAIETMLLNNVRRLLIEGGMIVTIRDLVYNWGRLNDSVASVATKDLLFVDPEVDVVEAAKIMTAKGVGSLLVGDGVKVEGIVTERDLLKALRPGREVVVKDVMNPDPLITTMDEYLSEVVDLMKERWTRHAVVVKDDRPVGVVSVRDIARALSASRNLRKTKVDEFMTIRVLSAEETASLEKVREVMATHNVGYVPIVNKEGKLVGGIGEKDLLASIVVSLF